MKYYCIGIKGAGMSTLAQILFDLGNEVVGYDDAKGYKFTQKGLEERNIQIYYDQNHELDKDMIVTYSVAFSMDHPEMKRVVEEGLQIKKYNEIISDVIDMFESIGVSGTHGKTTTSSIIKHILENTVGTNYFVGAGDGYASKDNKYFVVESDEFNKHFMVYHPKFSIITNIEAEHLECYKDIDDIRESFEVFANNTINLVVANGDNEEVRKINYKTAVRFFGHTENCDYVIKNEVYSDKGSSFDIYCKNDLFGHFELPLYGKHSVIDAVAAIIVCREVGIEINKIQELLKTFKNAARRFAEENINGSIIIDDYAHHPTEIKATLEAVRQKYPNKKLVAVFMPNTYSRTKDFTKEFIDSLNIADKVYLTDINCNREDPKDYPGITSDIIIAGLNNGEKISIETINKLVEEKDSVICFMSCAHIANYISAYKDLIK